MGWVVPVFLLVLSLRLSYLGRLGRRWSRVTRGSHKHLFLASRRFVPNPQPRSLQPPHDLLWLAINVADATRRVELRPVETAPTTLQKRKRRAPSKSANPLRAPPRHPQCFDALTSGARRSNASCGGGLAPRSCEGWERIMSVGVLKEILAGSAVAPLRGLSTLRPCDGAKKGASAFCHLLLSPPKPRKQQACRDPPYVIASQPPLINAWSQSSCLIHLVVINFFSAHNARA